MQVYTLLLYAAKNVSKRNPNDDVNECANKGSCKTQPENSSTPCNVNAANELFPSSPYFDDVQIVLAT